MTVSVPSGGVVWTEVRVARLRALWGSGKRAAEIATDIGVSRNAVIGKAHRLGLDDLRGPYRGKMISKGIRRFHDEHPEYGERHSRAMQNYWSDPRKRQEKSRQMIEYWVWLKGVSSNSGETE